MDIKTIVIYISCLIGIFVIGKIFIVPIKWILKLLINSILGALILYLINILGAICGLHIGINIITAVIVGLLGIPGAILLVLFEIFL